MGLGGMPCRSESLREPSTHKPLKAITVSHENKKINRLIYGLIQGEEATEAAGARPKEGEPCTIIAKNVKMYDRAAGMKTRGRSEGVSAN